MNTIQRGRLIGGDLLYANFNQDFDLISVGTNKGYIVYETFPGPFVKCHQQDYGSCGVVELLHRTSLVAIVGAGDQPSQSPRRLIVYNKTSQQILQILDFPSTVLGVKMNMRRLLVVLQSKICVYDLATVAIINTISTDDNPYGLVTLSPSREKSYFAYPSRRKQRPVEATSDHSASSVSTISNDADIGDVVVYDALSLTVVGVIAAHTSPISALVFNQEGNLLATASEKGTVLRIFSVPQCDKLYSFRRGTFSARIYSINFSVDSRFLCVSADSGTIHIFKVQSLDERKESDSSDSSRSSLSRHDSDNEQIQHNQNEPLPSSSMVGSSTSYASSARSWMTGFVGGVASVANQYLPNFVSDTWDVRSFATVKLRRPVLNIAAINPNNTEVIVLTVDGFFLLYSLDSSKGGVCKLQRENVLVEAESDELSTGFRRSD